MKLAKSNFGFSNFDFLDLLGQYEFYMWLGFDV